MHRLRLTDVPVLRIIVRNWPMKLVSLLMAVVLYTGLVFSGSFTDDIWRGVPVSFDGQDNTFLLSPVQVPTIDVEYRISRDSGSVIDAESFTAVVDLARYNDEQMGVPQELPISVSAINNGVEVRGYAPRTVTVTLDEVTTTTVPVEVDYGTVPEGVEIGQVEIDNTAVEVRGPASAVALVDRAVALLRIDPSGVDFNGQVELRALNVAGERVENIDIIPSEVGVSIPAETVETNKTVPVRPDLTGAPQAGYALLELNVSPSIVTLRGSPAALVEVEEVLTATVDIGGLSDDTEFVVELLVPEGLRLANPKAKAEATIAANFGPSVVGRTFLVGLRCSGVPAGATCLPALDQMSITLSGPAATLREIDAADLTLLLGVSGLGAGTYDVVPSVPSLPDSVEVVTISPERVRVSVVLPAPLPTPAPTASPATPVPTPQPAATPQPSEEPDPAAGG